MRITLLLSGSARRRYRPLQWEVRRLVRPEGTEDANFGGAGAQFVEGGGGLGIVKSGLQVEIKTVLPWAAGDGPALDFEKVNFAVGKNSERAVQRSGLMRELDHEGKFIGAGVVLIGMPERLGQGREKQEACVVFAMVLDVFEQDFAAVDFSGAFGGDGGARGIVGGNDFANAAGRVERSHALELRMRAEEMFALRERDRMRLHGGKTVERSVPCSDQVKSDRVDHFRDDVQMALEKQIV
ncbi:MAG TPA: hypothetical protein VJN69_04360 [Candidatus Acidoferrales bacterium]|nr:hypothetical protein [Candidatus Acidoferrales bacterium]